MKLKLWAELYHRFASDREKRKWTLFREQLDKSERKMFNEMMSYSRLYNAAGVVVCKPILIHPILMSIVFEHYKQLTKMKDKKDLYRNA